MRLFCLFAAACLAACSSQPANESEVPAPRLAAETVSPATPANGVVAATDEDEFKPPAGYKRRVEDGQVVYCAKIVVLGSRFPKDDCRTQAQLREMEMQKADARNSLDQSRAVCSAPGACGSR